MFVLCFFFAIDFCKCFLFSCFVFVYCHIVCLFHFFISIMHCFFNLFVFPNSMFTPLLLFFLNIFLWKGYELSGEIALKNNHYYYYYYYYSKCLHCSVPPSRQFGVGRSVILWLPMTHLLHKIPINHNYCQTT